MNNPPLIPIRRWIRHTDRSMVPPGDHVLVDAVDQRAVQIEQERGYRRSSPAQSRSQSWEAMMSRTPTRCAVAGKTRTLNG